MHYPPLTRIAGDKQLYLQGNCCQVRSANDVTRRDLAGDELAAWIVTEFGIDPVVAAHAMSILKSKGERLGRAAAG